MGNIKHLCVILAVAAVILSLAGCGGGKNDLVSTESAAGGTEDIAEKETIPAGQEEAIERFESKDTMTVSIGKEIEGSFSPFFYYTDDDRKIVDMFTLYTLNLDRQGSPVLNGIEGETHSYHGIDYKYSGPADITVTGNSDGTVTYELKLRKDMVFSDGVPVDIDDVIFGMYVLLDPTYDGSSSLNTVPIQGLQEYRRGIQPLWRLLVAAGKNNTSFVYWDEAVQTTFWNEALPAAGERFAQSILDYCVAQGYAREDDSIESIAQNWGFTLPENGTAMDFWNIMADGYEGDYTLLSAAEQATNTLWSYLDSEYNVGIETGDSALNISGIQRIDDYSLRVTTTEVQTSIIYNMKLPIAPLHYYGDESMYDFDGNMFGFPKGDLTTIREKDTAPLGAGPYVFVGYSDGTVFMDANSSYYKGEPKTAHLNFLECTETDKMESVIDGILDMADLSCSIDIIEEMVSEHDVSVEGEGALNESVLTCRPIENSGYGYIGFHPYHVKVGDDPASDASKNLRRALATVFAVYREASVENYYGTAASVIEYPIGSTSWVSLQAGDKGYREAYSADADGNDIYKAGMSNEERYAAAAKAALGYLEAAGYTVENGRVTAAPEGAKMSYECVLGGGGQGDHPCFLLARLAADALDAIGIKLEIIDFENASDVYNSILENTAEIWCAAWQIGADSYTLQRYYSAGTSNYFRIADDELDLLILRGYRSADSEYTKTMYQAAMNVVMNWAIEVPVYQRWEKVILVGQNVNTDTFPDDMTSYWGWENEVEMIQMK